MFTEIFEFRIREGNRESLGVACTAFAAAGARVPGLVRMEFLLSRDNPLVLWQVLRWSSSESVRPAQKVLFALEEMGLFSAFLASPPKRIGDFDGMGG